MATPEPRRPRGRRSAFALIAASFALIAGASLTATAAATAPTKAGATTVTDAQALAQARKILNQAKSGKSVNFKGTSGKTLGVLIPWTDNEGFQGMYLGVLTAAIKNNVSILTQSANNSAVTGVNILENFLTQKVDGMVIDAFDSAAFVSVVKKANKAGIPVVAYDQVPAAGKLLGAYASNNVQVGAGEATLAVRAAKAMGKKPGDLKILELYGALTSQAGVDRHKGVTQQAKKLGLNIVSSLPTEWDNAKANAAVLDAFQAHPDIDTIVMGSGCALWAGTSSALKSLGKLTTIGKDGYVAVISIDGCPAPMKAVRDGLIFGDSTQQLFTIGNQAGALAAKAVLGKKPKGGIHYLPPRLVTKANVNDPTQWANIVAGKK